MVPFIRAVLCSFRVLDRSNRRVLRCDKVDYRACPLFCERPEVVTSETDTENECNEYALQFYRALMPALAPALDVLQISEDKGRTSYSVSSLWLNSFRC